MHRKNIKVYVEFICFMNKLQINRVSKCKRRYVKNPSKTQHSENGSNFKEIALFQTTTKYLKEAFLV